MAIKQHSHRVLTVVTRLPRRGGSNQRLLSLVFAFAAVQGSILLHFSGFFLAMADVSDPKINEGAFVKFNLECVFSSSQTLSIRGCSLKQIRCQLGSRGLRGSPMIFFLKFFFVVLTFPDCMHGQGDRSDKLVVTATGTGGLTELQEQLDPDKASYAYARVTYSNDKESQREKFILITWIGSGCKIMRKAKVRLFGSCV
jgi:hypothetical protein